jgi:hypothetical protein
MVSVYMPRHTRGLVRQRGEASLKMRKELGTKVANEKVEHDFLMKGLKMETLGIVFQDKSELFEQNEEWEYLSK